MNELENEEKQTLSLRELTTQQKIRTLYMDGNNMYEISHILGIPKGTIDNAYYLNRHNFRDFMTQLKKERFLRDIEKESQIIIDMDTDENPRLLATKQKEMEFIRETLLKDYGYTKRSEVVGFNINKNEPLDEDQKEKLNKILNP